MAGGLTITYKLVHTDDDKNIREKKTQKPKVRKQDDVFFLLLSLGCCMVTQVRMTFDHIKILRLGGYNISREDAVPSAAQKKPHISQGFHSSSLH